MPSKPESLEWIDIADFSPGLTSTAETLQTPGPLGSAQEAWMCLPGPSGGLIPAPRMITEYTYPSLANVPSGQRDNQIGYGVVLDFLTLGAPLQTGQPDGAENSASTGSKGANDEFAILMQHYSAMGTGNERRNTHLRMHSLSASAIGDPFAGAGAPYQITTTTPNAGAMTFDSSWKYYGPGNLATTFVRDGTNQTAVYSFLACAQVRSTFEGGVRRITAPNDLSWGQMWSWGTPVAGALPPGGWWPITNDGSVAGFPDMWVNVAATTPLEIKLYRRNNVQYVVGHSGRGIAAVSNQYGVGVGGTYSNPMAYGVDGSSMLRASGIGGSHLISSWTNYFDIYEPIGGIAAMASLSSDDLFILGQTGGGARIRGDIGTTPQISRMPMLPSAYGRATHITHTPVGLVWGTRQGVWLWSGGDTAEPLSPQLSYDFWWNFDYEIYGYNHAKGRPVCSYPYLFFPNGYVCDLRFKSWFRFGEVTLGKYPTHYQLAYNGDILACQPFLPIDGTSAVLIRRYDPTRFHDSWVWKSQSFPQARNRVLSFREIAITVLNPTNVNELTLRIYGADRADGTYEAWEKMVEVPVSPYPQVLRFEMAVDVAEASLLMDSTAVGGGDAIQVNRVSLGYLPGPSVKRY